MEKIADSSPYLFMLFGLKKFSALLFCQLLLTTIYTFKYFFVTNFKNWCNLRDETTNMSMRVSMLVYE